jgi:hypothetical protein
MTERQTDDKLHRYPFLNITNSILLKTTFIALASRGHTIAILDLYLK